MLDAATRYLHTTALGLNPGLHRTDIRNNLFGEGSLKSRVMEWMIGLQPGFFRFRTSHRKRGEEFH